MSILFLQNGERDGMPTVRSWLNNAFESAADQPPPTSYQRSQIYASSNIGYRAANKRGDAVSSVPQQILDSAKSPLPDTDPLVKALRRNYRETIRRSEVTLCFWGYNLLAKRRAYSGNLYELRWINPNMYMRDVQFRGLKGFRIMAQRSGIPERYIKLGDAVFQHEIDFNDDFGGIAPAQVVVNDILGITEMSLTKKAFMENRAVPNWIAGAVGDLPHQQPKEEDATRLTKLLQSTFKGSVNAGRTLIDRFRWQFTNLTMDWDKIKFTEQYADAYEAVAIAFDIPIALIRESASNYAQAEVARRDWANSWLVRRCEWYGEVFTEQILKDPYLLRRYGSGLTVAPDFDEVQMLKEDDEKKVNKVNAQVTGGYRDLHTAAVETGVKDPPEALKGVYMWGGKPTHISSLAQVMAQPALETGGTANPLMLPSTSGVLPPPPTSGGIQQPPAQQAADVPPVGKPINIMISLSNDPELIGLQNRLKQLMPNTPVTWLDPAKFHVTLLSAPAVPDEQINMLKAALDQVTWVDDMTLPIGSLRSFDKLGEHAIHFSLRTNTDLLELQQALVELCISLGIQISTYSRPENYKPHVTMGMSTQKPSAIIFQSKIKVMPQKFVFSVDMQTVYERAWIEGDEPEPPPEEPEPEPTPAAKAFLPDAIFSELKVAARKGAGFVPDKLPKATITYITHLKELGFETDAVLEAAKSFTQSVLAAKAVAATQRDFEREFDDLISQARGDETTRKAASAKLRYLINIYTERAFIDGLIDGGMEEPEITADDKQTLAKIKSDQSKFVTDFMASLFKGDGISDDQAVYKATQWFNGSIHPAYLAGLESAAADGLFEWQIGKTEKSCGSCLDLNGQIHRFSEYKAIGLLPKANKLICGRGNLCDCDLKPTTGKPRGSLKSVRTAARSHEHEEHEHEPENVDAVPEPVI